MINSTNQIARSAFTPGSDNPAEFMSRHPSVKTIKSCEQSIAEHYVKFVMSQAIPRAMTLDEVKIASSKDKTSKGNIICENR
jgi:hypothetical protein